MTAGMVLVHSGDIYPIFVMNMGWITSDQPTNCVY